MTKGLDISDNEIEFIGRKLGDIPLSAITKSFKIRFEDVRLIALSPRLALDDEILIITMIDSNKSFYQFSCFEFGSEAITTLEKKFGLNGIRNVEWVKFNWDDHQDYITDKVIFPSHLYWQNLFIRPKKIKKAIIQWLKFFGIRKSVGGRFTPKILAYLNNR